MQLKRRAGQLLVLLVSIGGASFVCAQTEQNAGVISPDMISLASAAPYADFQLATITGSSNNVSISWVPVIATNGAVSYYDLALQFQLDASGKLSLASGFPKITPSPVLTVSGFRAGKYVGPSNVLSGIAYINVSGPGIAPGGASEWTLAAAPNGNACTYPSSATWYVGPIPSGPLAARLKTAGISSTTLSYGLGAGTCYGTWNNNPILGLSQAGNTITIFSYTDSYGDHALPVAQITYTLVQ